MRPEAQERHESTNTTSVTDALILEGNGNETNYERNLGLTTLMTEGDVSRFYFCVVQQTFPHHHFRMREQQQCLSCMLAEQ